MGLTSADSYAQMRLKPCPAEGLALGPKWHSPFSSAKFAVQFGQV